MDDQIARGKVFAMKMNRCDLPVLISGVIICAGVHVAAAGIDRFFRLVTHKHAAFRHGYAVQQVEKLGDPCRVILWGVGVHAMENGADKS